MRKNIALLLLIPTMLFACGNTQKNADDSKQASQDSTQQSSVSDPAKGENYGKVIKISAAEFKELIYNYEANPQSWVFRGDKPCVIDFYADWCRPCKMIAPILDELALEYAGKVNFYKVDTQVEQELARAFNISSIPLVVFCGVQGNPQGTMGAYPKEEYKRIIETIIKQ